MTKVGIVKYPGSNCIEDAIKYFESHHNDVVTIWHREHDFTPYKYLDLLVIPGGFAFGDRYYVKATQSYSIAPGQMAKESPVTKIIMKCHANKIPILGICNGFQILLQLGLLPGKLCQNITHHFSCQNVWCKIHSSLANNLEDENQHNDKYLLNIANGYGNYQCTDEEYNNLIKNDQILLTYDPSNFEFIKTNGSKHNIAGIMNKEKTIIGMMPHPERDLLCNDNIYPIISKFMANNPMITKLNKNIEKLMSSEHISYKTTKKYLKHLYSNESHVIVGPGENAGIVDIGNGYSLAIRIESHNHPTFIDPYNGAATGVGGILRDIFTMGARPIAILDFLRFGTDLNSNTLLNNAIKGISDYGNCFGVANVGGDCKLCATYDKNPLVNVAAIGILKTENLVLGHATTVGEKLIYVGAKTGLDGIGGADMASQNFDSRIDLSDLKKNIQVGDPFLEKLLLEACMEITNRKLAVGMQDLGAGGLLCATLEVVQRGRKNNKQLGCVIYSDKIPTKCDNMDACDKLISESQERMLIVVNDSNVNDVYEILETWDLEYVCIGETTCNNNYVVMDGDNNIIYDKPIDTFESYECNIGMTWAEIANEYDLKYQSKIIGTGNMNDPNITNINSLEGQFMNSININESKFISYDKYIGNRSISLGHNDNNLSRLAIPEVDKELMIIWGSTLQKCYQTYVANYGYKYLMLGYVNCLNFGDPKTCINDLGTFLYETNVCATTIRCPVLGGNVSLYNATDGVSIPHSPIIVLICISR